MKEISREGQKQKKEDGVPTMPFPQELINSEPLFDEARRYWGLASAYPEVFRVEAKQDINGGVEAFRVYQSDGTLIYFIDFEAIKKLKKYY